MSPEFKSFTTYLKSIAYFNEIDLETAMSLVEIKEIKKGDYFIKEGKVCNHIAFINKGIYRIFKLKNGEELNVCFCIRNGVMSSFESFVNRSPTNEYIQALEDSEILILSFDNLNKLITSNPEWNKIRLTLTNQECIRLAERANSLSFETALEKYQNLTDKEPHIIQRVSNYHIASYLGITPETLSRIRAKIS